MGVPGNACMAGLLKPSTDATEFGFGVSIWGRDMERCQRIADQMDNAMGKQRLRPSVVGAAV